MSFDPKWIAEIQRAVQDASRQYAANIKPLMDQINRDTAERAREFGPLIAEIARQSEARARELAPLVAAVDKANKEAVAAIGPALREFAAFQALPTGTSFLLPPRDWETPAKAAVEKIKTEAGGPEPAKAELAFELALGVADATDRLIASSTENRIALAEAIGRLVESSNSNTATMSRLTERYVTLTRVLALAAVVGLLFTAAQVYLAWQGAAPPQVNITVPAPVVNVQPAIELPMPASAMPSEDKGQKKDIRRPGPASRSR